MKRLTFDGTLSAAFRRRFGGTETLDWAAVHRASLRRTAAVTAAALIASTGLSAGAEAEDAMLLGGGAGITLNGDTLCTLTAIGHDSADRLIGFTAAHCGGPGSLVVADGVEDHGTVGTVVAADDGLGYAVVEFDPLKVRPIADYEGFGIYDLVPDPGDAPQACKLGRATGVMCWDTQSSEGDPADNQWWEPGDDGAPVTVDDRLVGMVRDGSAPVLPLGLPGSGIVLFQAILDDVNARGGPGAGFTLG